MRAYKQKIECEPFCANCEYFEDDPETGRVYGICAVAKELVGSGERLVKGAFEVCNE